jgi:hypothetical protein
MDRHYFIDRVEDGVVDFKQDNWRVKHDYPTNGEWTGKTFFRVYGPYESDCNIEATEIREALTDYEFVGRVREQPIRLILMGGLDMSTGVNR